MEFFSVNSDLYKLICLDGFCSKDIQDVVIVCIEVEDNGVMNGKGCNKIGNYKDRLLSRVFFLFVCLFL